VTFRVVPAVQIREALRRWLRQEEWLRAVAYGPGVDRRTACGWWAALLVTPAKLLRWHRELVAIGARVILTPVRSPRANAFGARFVRT